LTSNLKVSFYGYMAWSADNSYVYFDANVGGNTGYFRLRISDSKLEQLIDLKKIRLFPDQFNGYWTGLGPGDSPLFARDISTQEIYALDVDLP